MYVAAITTKPARAGATSRNQMKSSFGSIADQTRTAKKMASQAVFIDFSITDAAGGLRFSAGCGRREARLAAPRRTAGGAVFGPVPGVARIPTVES